MSPLEQTLQLALFVKPAFSNSIKMESVNAKQDIIMTLLKSVNLAQTPSVPHVPQLYHLLQLLLALHVYQTQLYSYQEYAFAMMVSIRTPQPLLVNPADMDAKNVHLSMFVLNVK